MDLSKNAGEVVDRVDRVRGHDEIDRARSQWNAGGDDRFGEVAHYPTDERLAAPPLPNVRLQPRGRVSARSSP